MQQKGMKTKYGCQCNRKITKTYIVVNKTNNNLKRKYDRQWKKKIVKRNSVANETQKLKKHTIIMVTIETGKYGCQWKRSD